MTADGHIVICGSNDLAWRTAETLVNAHQSKVVVLHTGGPARFDGLAVRLLPVSRLDEEAFRQADLAGASAVGLLDEDDVGNIQAALAATELSPSTRVVLCAFNTALGQGVARLLEQSVVISPTTLVAPSVVAAALGEPGPSITRLDGRTLGVAHRADVRPESVVAGLAVTEPVPTLLPSDESAADLVLADTAGVVTRTATVTAGPRRRRFRRLRRAVTRWRTGPVIRTLLALELVLFVAGVVGVAARTSLSWFGAIVATLAQVAGQGSVALGTGPVDSLIRLALATVGLTFIPLVVTLAIDVVVSGRLRLADGGSYEDHVIVAGLGGLGTRTLATLRDLGVLAVGVDPDERARGVEMARSAGIPAVVGDLSSEMTFTAAGVHRAKALVVLAGDDVTNLEIALRARTLNPDLRVVLGLGDGDFAERIRRSFNIRASLNASQVAAPAVAGALLGVDVVQTVAIERRTLHVVVVQVRPDTVLDGALLNSVDVPHEIRVLQLRTRDGEPTWNPGDRRLVHGDRLTAICTPAGLGMLVTRATRPYE